jgi:hypothetical protein
MHISEKDRHVLLAIRTIATGKYFTKAHAKQKVHDAFAELSFDEFWERFEKAQIIVAKPGLGQPGEDEVYEIELP